RSGARQVHLHGGRWRRRSAREDPRCGTLSLRPGPGPAGHPAPFRPRGSHHRLRLPRDVSGDDLAKALGALGYRLTRQTGSHLRLTTTERGEHHVTVPRHAALRVGTLAGVLGDV